MLFYTVGQSEIFLATLYAGFAVGLWYDVTRLARHLLSSGRWLTPVIDFAFGLGCAALMIAALLLANYAQLRLYAFLGVLCGALIYWGTLHPLLGYLGALLRRGARSLTQALWRVNIVKKIFK